MESHMTGSHVLDGVDEIRNSSPQRAFGPVFGLGLEREDGVAEVPLVPLVADKMEADGVVDSVHEREEI